MTTAIFKLTNGTQSVDLLELREGVNLTLWQQVVAQYKSGGTFRQSSLSDGRRLVDKRFAEIRETLQIKIGAEGGIEQDISISILHELFALMEGASDYWVHDWNSTPVWLESRASCETNTRYALVVTANMVDLDDIYAEPFSNAGEFSNLTLQIEHEHWTENQPGVGIAVPISAVETYDGRDLGNVDSSGDRDPDTSGVYIASQRVEANLTHIFTWSAANGFSANLMDAALPYDLIDDVGAAPAVNDLVYFGIDTTKADSGPFTSLVFDIGTAQTGHTLAWEQYNGAWVNLTTRDNTATAQPLDTAGTNSVYWVFSGAVVTVAINGVTGYWVRLKITALAGALVTPAQQNRDVYSIIWPYTEIQSTEIEGDLPALARVKLAVQSHTIGGAGQIPSLLFGRALIGLRTVTRGENFTSILNAADEQNPAGITVAVGANSAFIPYVLAPTGRMVDYTTVGVDAIADRVKFTLDTTIAPHFYGTFRALVRCWNTSWPAQAVTVQLRARYGSGGEDITNVATTAESVINYSILDMGKISIAPQGILTTSDAITVELAIQAGTDGATTFYIYDLILIPVDEWAIDAQDTVDDNDSAIEESRYLDIDGIVNPKVLIRSLGRESATDEVTAMYLSVKNGPPILQRNSRQRLWCFLMRSSGLTTVPWAAYPQTSATIEVEKRQRYLGPRGTM